MKYAGRAKTLHIFQFTIYTQSFEMDLNGFCRNIHRVHKTKVSDAVFI